MQTTLRHALLTLILLTLPSLLTTPATAAPKIACDAPTQDFGEVTDRESVDHVFTLRNDGDEALTIIRVQTTCGCTTAKLDNETVPPGGSVALNTTLSLRGRSGLQSKTIFIHSNDPETPRFPLTLQVNIRRDLTVTPQQAYFPVNAKGPVAPRTISITFDPSTPAAITGIQTNNADFAIANLRIVTPGLAYALDITLKENQDFRGGSGTLSGNVELSTDHPKHPKITVPIVVYVRRETLITPPKIILTELPTPDHPITKTFRVQNRTTVPITLSSVTPPSAAVTVTPKALTDYAYSVTTVITDAADLHGQAILLKVDGQNGTETLAVPIEIWQGALAK